MNTLNSSLNKAQAVLSSLFEACHEIDSSEIETNLSVINSYLCDAIESTSKSTREDTHHLTNTVNNDIADDIFNAVITADKLKELSHIYSGSYFTDKDNSNPLCLMASVIYDYASIVSRELKAIEEKIS